jgi:hypothetical protein
LGRIAYMLSYSVFSMSYACFQNIHNLPGQIGKQVMYRYVRFWWYLRAHYMLLAKLSRILQSYHA